MNTVIETKNLTKYYGKDRGVENLNLEVKEGEIFGFLGPNGAGKTTTIRLLLRLINPTSGKAFIFGKDASQHYVDILRNVGYLSGDLNLYEKMSGKELLDFSSSFYNLPAVAAMLQAGLPASAMPKALQAGKKNLFEFRKEIIERLKCNLNAPFKKLSKGNKQKIGVLLALFHKPKLLVLDEPTAGLDPLTQNELYKILFDLKKEGTTTFLSSHNLPEVEKVCDRIGIIREGELVDVETIEELRAHRKKIAEVHFEESYKKEDFYNLEGAEIIEARENFLHLYVKSSAINPFLKLLSDYRIKDINFSYPDLEKVFLKYYEKPAPARNAIVAGGRNTFSVAEAGGEKNQ